MKKLIISAMLSILCAGAFAQVEDDDDFTHQHCEMIHDVAEDVVERKIEKKYTKANMLSVISRMKKKGELNDETLEVYTNVTNQAYSGKFTDPQLKKLPTALKSQCDLEYAN